MDTLDAPTGTARGQAMRSIKLHLHGWAVALESYRKCRRKKHGAKDPGFKIAANIALNARAIAIRKPMAAPTFGRPWRWYFGNSMRFHKP